MDLPPFFDGFGQNGLYKRRLTDVLNDRIEETRVAQVIQTLDDHHL